MRRAWRVALACAVLTTAAQAQDTTRVRADTVRKAPTTGVLAGTITDLTGQPLGGADVVIFGTAMRAKSNADGKFTLPGIPAGDYDVLFRKLGFVPAEFTANVAAGMQQNVAVKLEQLHQKLDTVTITAEVFNEMAGLITDTVGNPIEDVDVRIVGSEMRMHTRDDGRFLFLDVPTGRYLIQMRKLGYRPVQKSVEMVKRIDRHLAVRMTPVAQGLSPVMITAESGYGPREEVAMRDFEVRRKMAGTESDLITREDLAELGKAPLSWAIRMKGKGIAAKDLAGISCVLIDGDQPAPASRATSDGTRVQTPGGGGRFSGTTSGTIRGQRGASRTATPQGETTPLGFFFADQVEAIELYPEGSEMSSTACARLTNINGCDCDAARSPPVVVVWLRH
jgi:hypothetical protein